VSWGKWVVGYFNFTRKDRIGVIILVFLILIILVLPRFFAGSGAAVTTLDTAWVAGLRALEIKQQKKEKVQNRDTDYHTYATRYDRSPHTTPKKQYLQTGSPALKNTRGYRKVFEYDVININTADTTAFIALPGIGSKLAIRIINFREKLGGFYTVGQIGEVYGLADSVFQKIRQYLQLKDPLIKKININTATVDQLKAHPYIKYNIANAIIAYRNSHGPFLNIEDTKKIMLITEEWYNKTSAYLSIE